MTPLSRSTCNEIQQGSAGSSALRKKKPSPTWSFTESTSHFSACILNPAMLSEEPSPRKSLRCMPHGILTATSSSDHTPLNQKATNAKGLQSRNKLSHSWQSTESFPIPTTTVSNVPPNFGDSGQRLTDLVAGSAWQN